jgi:hypothetical protein
MLPSLPSKAYRQSKDDIDIPLSALDPETSRLIPTKKHAHRAWIQGRLAPVRVASTTSLRNAPPKYSDVFASPSQCDHDNGGLRRRSLDDGGASGGAANGDGLDDDESDGADKEVRYQARQLRGYGIGGAGNISQFFSLTPQS